MKTNKRLALVTLNENRKARNHYKLLKLLKASKHIKYRKGEKADIYYFMYDV